MKSNEETITHTAKITNITYRYDKDGNITPSIKFSPRYEPENTDVYIETLSLIANFVDTVNIEDIRVGNIITIDVVHNGTPKFQIESVSLGDGRPIVLDRCPVCGIPLLESDIGMGQCLNRTCMAQINFNTIMFLSSLGISLNQTVTNILHVLFANGVIRSPISVFQVGMPDLLYYDIKVNAAAEFIAYVNSVRGHISLAQVLKGLRIPGWDPTIIDDLVGYLQEPENLLNLTFMCDFNFIQKELPEVNWTPWIKFLGVGDNRFLIQQIETLLVN